MIKLHILVPTYERAICLDQLLDFFATNFADHNQLYVTVFDNSSNPFESASLAEFRRNENFIYTHNSKNLGGVENIIKCLKNVHRAAEYFWVIPDDIIPDKSFLEQLLRGEFGTSDALIVSPISQNGIARTTKSISLSECHTANMIVRASWLPSVIYKTTSIRITSNSLKFYANHSYPHLLAFFQIINNANARITEVTIAFENNNNDTPARYKWLSGSALKIYLILRGKYGTENGSKMFFTLFQDKNYYASMKSSMLYESSKLKWTEILTMLNFVYYKNIIFVLSLIFMKIIGSTSVEYFSRLINFLEKKFIGRPLTRASKVVDNFKSTKGQSHEF